MKVTLMVSDYSMFTFIGLILVALGLLTLLVPILMESGLPEWLQKIPSILIYVYRRDGFVFVTSPILIAFSILFLLYRWIRGAS